MLSEDARTTIADLALELGKAWRADTVDMAAITERIVDVERQYPELCIACHVGGLLAKVGNGYVAELGGTVEQMVRIGWLGEMVDGEMVVAQRVITAVHAAIETGVFAAHDREARVPFPAVILLSQLVDDLARRVGVQRTAVLS